MRSLNKMHILSNYSIVLPTRIDIKVSCLIKIPLFRPKARAFAPPPTQHGDFAKMYEGPGPMGPAGGEDMGPPGIGGGMAPPGEENGKGWDETLDGMGQMGLPLGSLGKQERGMYVYNDLRFGTLTLQHRLESVLN